MKNAQDGVLQFKAVMQQVALVEQDDRVNAMEMDQALGVSGPCAQ